MARSWATRGCREWYKRSLEENKKRKSCNLVESKERKPRGQLTTSDEDATNLDLIEPKGPILAKPGEDIVEVPIDNYDQSRVLKIGSQLNREQKFKDEGISKSSRILNHMY